MFARGLDLANESSAFRSYSARISHKAAVTESREWKWREKWPVDYWISPIKNLQALSASTSDYRIDPPAPTWAYSERAFGRVILNGHSGRPGIKQNALILRPLVAEIGGQRRDRMQIVGRTTKVHSRISEQISRPVLPSHLECQPLGVRFVFTWPCAWRKLAAELARIRAGQIPGELSSFRTWGKKGRQMKCRARNTVCHSCVAVRAEAKSGWRLFRGVIFILRAVPRARRIWRGTSSLTWKKAPRFIL